METPVESVDEIRAELMRLWAGDKGREKLVFTNGVFDVLHVGHLRTLRLARRQGDVLIVGVNTDESVRVLKGPYRPINPLAARLEMLDALDIIDYLVPFGTAADPSVEPLIAALQPDVLVKGGDYSPDGVVGAALVERRGGRTVIAPKAEGVSSTDTIERMQKRFTTEGTETTEKREINHPSSIIPHQLQPWVFVDLDGVLVDFFGSMAKALGRDWDPEKCRGEYDPGQMFGCRTDLFSVFGPDFWETADWMPDGPRIWITVHNAVDPDRILVCSSPTHETGSMTGKLRWIERFLGSRWMRRYVFTPDKWLLASPNAILIDDSDEQVDAFCGAGGTAILVPRPWNSLWQFEGDVVTYVKDQLEFWLSPTHSKTQNG